MAKPSRHGGSQRTRPRYRGRLTSASLRPSLDSATALPSHSLPTRARHATPVRARRGVGRHVIRTMDDYEVWRRWPGISSGSASSPVGQGRACPICASSACRGILTRWMTRWPRRRRTARSVCTASNPTGGCGVVRPAASSACSSPTFSLDLGGIGVDQRGTAPRTPERPQVGITTHPGDSVASQRPTAENRVMTLEPNSGSERCPMCAKHRQDAALVASAAAKVERLLRLGTSESGAKLVDSY